MEKLTITDFNGLVYRYGEKGTEVIEDLNEAQKQIIYSAWAESESIEEPAEADNKINSYYNDFIKAGATVEKKYTGYGYHGGGRKKTTGTIRQSLHISGQPEQLQALKAKAEAAGLTLSAYVLQLAGIN